MPLLEENLIKAIGNLPTFIAILLVVVIVAYFVSRYQDKKLDIEKVKADALAKDNESTNEQIKQLVSALVLANQNIEGQTRQISDMRHSIEAGFSNLSHAVGAMDQRMIDYNSRAEIERQTILGATQTAAQHSLAASQAIDGAVQTINTHTTNVFSDHEKNMIAALAQMEARFYEAIQANTAGETIETFRDELSRLVDRVDQFISQWKATAQKDDQGEHDDQEQKVVYTGNPSGLVADANSGVGAGR